MTTKQPKIKVQSYKKPFDGHLESRAGTVNENLASQNTVFLPQIKTAVLDYADYGAHVFDLIEHIHQDWQVGDNVYHHMYRLTGIIKVDVPKTFRPVLFKRLNQLMGMLMAQFLNDKKMFEACFKLLTAIKTHIDRDPQSEEASVEEEWNGLQSAAYMLSDWEDQITALEEATSERTAMPIDRK